jgi:hypothetical protein
VTEAAQVSAPAEEERPGEPDADKSPAFSPSRLEKALGCPAAYEFSYVLKMFEPKKASMELGNWIDDVLNVYWNHRLHLGVEHPLSDLLAYADRMFEKYRSKVFEWDMATDAHVARARLVVALTKYTETWGQRLEPIGVQSWVNVPAGIVGSLRVHGKPDLIARDHGLPGAPLVVVDHKTKAKGFYSDKPGAREKAERALRMDVKMNLYAAGLGLAGTPAAFLRLIGLVFTEEATIQEVEVRTTRQSVQWALHSAQAGARIIEGGRFYPNPQYQWCGTCPFTQACNSRYGAGE